MRFFYTFCLYLALPFILLRLFWRGRKIPSYRKRWLERFGFFDSPHAANYIWIHAVSVGETIAALPLIKKIIMHNPNASVVITTTTPTGSERVKALLPEVFHVYVPYDLPSAINRFLVKVKPILTIIMETELWPNLIHCCHNKNIPVIIANARLSPRSAARYAKVRKLTHNLLNKITFIASQNELDIQRFIQLGMPENKITVTGSIKFNMDISEDLLNQARQLYHAWGSRPTWIAASTHAGEDEVILAAHQALLKEIPSLLLVLVPRHPDRFLAVMQLCQQHHLSYIQRSHAVVPNQDTQVVVGDTMGELLLLYGLADIAFVGGSLVKTGGHNMLEPVAMGIPVITGPYVFNFAEISQTLSDNHALCMVNELSELVREVTLLLQNSNKRDQMTAAGEKVLQDNHDALDKLYSIIKPYLDNALKIFV